MSVKVKICGIKNIDTALATIAAGADFLGFNFVSTSERYIEPMKALEIISKLKGKTKIVGVFQNADFNYVNKIAKDLELDFVQLHGNEDEIYIKQIVIPVIKLIVHGEKIKTKYFILDRSKQGRGSMVDFAKAAKLARENLIFFAGRLNPDNVAEVIQKVRPFAVDVAGGIETDGVQDIKKIELFIKNARGATL